MCRDCNSTGLLPFKRKDGSIVPGAFLYCQCYQEPEERYHTLKPEDFDYPMSYDHYRSLCQYHGWPDPGSDRQAESIEVNRVEPKIAHPVAIPRKYEYQSKTQKPEGQSYKGIR